ncbi:MAG: chaperonin GroEL, partial [Planctomycetes bacterium]|nr:chaperonin GroEL [Planctomycetota bacterium]
MAKQLIFDAEAQEALRNGVQKLAKAVKSTLGPRGRTVVIDRGFGGPTITKDGYSVADEIQLSCPYENLGAQLLREAADKTNDVSGDGTTTSTVLAEAIYNHGLKALTAGANSAAVQRGIKTAVDAVCAELAKQAKKITLADKGKLTEIATIAANGDDVLGKTLVDALVKVGADGVVNVEEGKGLETEVNVVEGMQFDRGYLSPHFVTDAKTLECDLKSALVLIHEDKISNIKKLIPLLEKVAKSGKPLLIIAEDIEGEALATLVVNKLRGTMQVAAVKAPGYGDRRKAMLKDLAILTGANAVFKDLAVDVEALGLKDLGSARRITITSDHTTIVQGGGKKAELEERIAQIRREIADTDSNYDREKLEERLAKLAGGVAVISIGGSSEAEVKEKKARTKDAKASMMAALEEGILPGGGVALCRARKVLDKLKAEGDESFGVEAVRQAVTAPLKQIADNAGAEGSVAVKKVLDGKDGFGYDAMNDSYRDLIEAGVIDPAKVTRTALINAASVATMLLSTNALITDVPKKADAGPPMGGDMGGMG